MENESRWDNRRSGRTTRTLTAAFRRAYNGHHVVVVSPDAQFYEYCVPTLRALGATRFSSSMLRCHVGEGSNSGTITFLPMGNALVEKNSLSVKGTAVENTFWDHETIRRAYNRELQMFFKY